jgi:hypothetical protein
MPREVQKLDRREGAEKVRGWEERRCQKIGIVTKDGQRG